MNKNYGKLDGQTVECAPDTIVEDSIIVSNPSDATYLASGWKRIVDNPPPAEDGCTVRPSGWEESGETIARTYKQVPDGPAPANVRVFSKLKLVAALKEADKWVLVKTWIEEKGYYDYYVAAQNFREDNPLFSEALAAIKNYARMSDEDAEVILSKCIYEED